MKTIIIIIFIFLNSNLFAQTDSLIYQFRKNISVFKNLKKQTYEIKKNNKIIWKNLKFIYPTYGSYIQVLDKQNSCFYIDDKGKKCNNINININLCGTVPHYTYEIIETNDKYILTEDETFFDYNNSEPRIEIASINKDDIQNINFYNNERKIEITSIDFILNSTKVFPQAIIIEKNGKKGLFYENELIFYDEIIYDNGIFKIKKNDLLGYYKITQPKYKELNGFTFGLAKFKTENGKTGYIDNYGNEYYD